MRAKQNQTIMVLMGVIIMLLLVVVVIFAFQGKKTEAPPSTDSVKTEAPTRTYDGPQVSVDTTPVYVPPDSSRITDSGKLSEIESFFRIYSRANRDEDVNTLLDLYTYPTFYIKKTYDKNELRAIIVKFFDHTRPIEHNFNNMSAYQFESGEVSALITEVHNTFDENSDKTVNTKVRKYFKFVPSGNGYRCMEQLLIAKLKAD